MERSDGEAVVNDFLRGHIFVRHIGGKADVHHRRMGPRPRRADEINREGKKPLLQLRLQSHF